MLSKSSRAIDFCRSTLPTTEANDASPFILLVTDGPPTVYHDVDFIENNCTACRNAAITAADGAKSQGITIEMLFVSPRSPPVDVERYMNTVSSDSYLDVSDFSKLDEVVNQISLRIACGAATEKKRE